ncbi:hypothetical protein KIL84_020082, partial [Mauremys mutica]
CFQALILVDKADGRDLLALTNVNNVTTEDGMERSKPRLQPSVSNENTTGSPLMEAKEKSHSGNEDVCSETRELPLKLCYQNHDCSNVCLANRPLNSYKGENPLKIPILCHFQRRHAKADSLSKSLDVNYKAPCGRSLRNFQDVQSYLSETECNFLFVDHFSFNTYVQLGRNTLNREALVFDFDISNGAESVPISFCNEVDSARLPYFKYRKASWPRGYYLNNFSSMFLDSCDCTDGCTDRSKCACLQLTAKGCSENSASPSNRASCGYRYKRLDGPVPSGIYECNLLCKCDRMRCQNRVAQHGIQVRLQVFNTDRKGWGVRCLDDIDKGTFVCTYSGRLMSRAEPQETRDVNYEAEKKDAVNDSSLSSLSVKRKLDTACSDSEIELVQTGKDSINRRCETLSQPAEDEYKPVVVQNYGYNPRNLRSPAIRPKTRTSILQTRRLKLGIATLVHDASSDEDDSCQPQQSTKTKLTTGTKKGKEKPNLQQKVGEHEEAMQSESSTTDTAKSKEKRPSPDDARGGKSARLEDAHVMKQSMGLLQRDDFKEEKNRRSKQDPPCNEETGGDETPLKNSNKDNIYLLDATKEGNVGRFLNLELLKMARGPSKAQSSSLRAADSRISLSPGDFQIMEKMVKRKCAFCPADEGSAIMYIAEKQNLAVHQDCLLYSSGFVESEEHNPENQDTRFDVASVQSEIRRGKRLMCNFCRKKGATVGCEIKTCRRSYHYFCALCDDAALETDIGQGIYRVFCPKHDPGKRTNHYDADNKRNRHGMKSSTFTEKRSTEETAAENSLRLLRKKHNKHKARIDFLRKCKQAGLLDGIFKEMLDTLHLAKEKLMDDNTSETEYEETVISLFDCSLFENILTNVHSGTEEKLQELLETRKRLDTQIELLQDLKEVIPFQENIASASSSVSE